MKKLTLFKIHVIPKNHIKFLIKHTVFMLLKRKFLYEIKVFITISRFLVTKSERLKNKVCSLTVKSKRILRYLTRQKTLRKMPFYPCFCFISYSHSKLFLPFLEKEYPPDLYVNRFYLDVLY